MDTRFPKLSRICEVCNLEVEGVDIPSKVCAFNFEQGNRRRRSLFEPHTCASLRRFVRAFEVRVGMSEAPAAEPSVRHNTHDTSMKR
eukprot:1178967-Prorocentrum_minimum.AAC.3